jgi:hypothetical protein
MERNPNQPPSLGLWHKPVPFELGQASQAIPSVLPTVPAEQCTPCHLEKHRPAGAKGRGKPHSAPGGMNMGQDVPN